MLSTKNIIKKLGLLSVATLSVFFNSGCEGKISQSSNGITETQLEVGQVYTINEGDKVVDDGDAKIEVIHLVSNNIKQVKILSGSARLIHGNFEVSQ